MEGESRGRGTYMRLKRPSRSGKDAEEKASGSAHGRAGARGFPQPDARREQVPSSAGDTLCESGPVACPL